VVRRTEGVRVLAVTYHAIDRYRERFPPATAWDDGEVAARVRWHVGRGVPVGPAFGRHKRLMADAGLVFVVIDGRRVVTVMTETMLLVDAGRDRKRRRW
jgi:hypothetical protein